MPREDEEYHWTPDEMPDAVKEMVDNMMDLFMPKFAVTEDNISCCVLDGTNNIDKVVLREDNVLELYLKPMGLIRFRIPHHLESDPTAMFSIHPPKEEE